VHELDRDTGFDRRRPLGRRQVDEQGTQPLSARGEGLPADVGDDAAVRGDRVV
jgi:hypothetical protein